nr:PREDICTED: uncharacterized protein LOC109036784 [Bemisia tabaci]
MFELDDDFDFDDEDFDKICTGKTLDKSAKFTSVETDEKKKEKPPELQSAFDQYAEDDDELLLSVIEPDPLPERNDTRGKPERKLELVDSEKLDLTIQPPSSKNSSSSKKSKLQSPLNVSGNSSIFSPSSRLDSSASVTPIVCQRKFPGPAGLLPKRTSNAFKSPHSSMLTDFNFDDCSSLQKTVCSQNSNASFEAGPWQYVMRDFAAIEKEDCMLNNFTVAWVKRKAIARQFVKNRVPFLAALLTSLDCSALDKVSGPVVFLKDPTGEIQGTLHREAWDKFGPYLVIGSVLVLRQVAVYTAGTSTRQQYLNITAKSIAIIYPPDSSPKLEVYPVSLEEVMHRIGEWKIITQQSINDSLSVRNPVQPIAPRSLFSTSSAQQSKSAPCLGEPASKRPCYESNNVRRNNVPSPFPIGLTKSSSQGSSLTNISPRISLNSSRPPQKSNSIPKVQNSFQSSTCKSSSNSKMSAGESANVKPQTNTLHCLDKTKENKVPESKTCINSLPKMNDDDLSVLSSVLEGIDADMFDDF